VGVGADVGMGTVVGVGANVGVGVGPDLGVGSGVGVGVGVGIVPGSDADCSLYFAAMPMSFPSGNGRLPAPISPQLTIRLPTGEVK
jgi:hypothetical protein